MKKFKTYLFSLLILISFNTKSFSKGVPESFADLAEKLMPSVVNISTTQTVVTNTNPFPFIQFPPGSPFEDMFKEFGGTSREKIFSPWIWFYN
jgi:serine protease Do